MNKPVVSIVVPCFNEAEAIPVFVQKVTDILFALEDENLISEKSFILFIDDGSTDQTWDIIERYANMGKKVAGIQLTRNFGQQNALFAGYEKAQEKSDVMISIDVDLQDDPSVIKEMILKYMEGYDIIYGVRSSREKDPWLKRNTSYAFYKLMHSMGIHIVRDHAHYRLLSKRVVQDLLKYQESNLFLQGIIPLLGFKQTKVYYKREERSAGKSKYNARKLIESAIDGITSFSTAPLRWISLTGFAILLISIAMGVYSLSSKIFGLANSGWTSLMLSIWCIGGLLIVSLGIIGEYVGKIYIETKKRPRYSIKEIVERSDKEAYEHHNKYRSFDYHFIDG